MNRALLLPVVIVWASATAASAEKANDATITGTVVVTRNLTKARVTLPAYQVRGVPVGLQDAASARRAGAGDDEFARVVIYLQGSGLGRGAPVNVRLAQKDRQFDQEIVVVPAGSNISFPNEDAIFHNVFSLSKAKQFDLGYYPKGETRIVKFERPGVVQVYCHIHPNMSAAILVLPTAVWTRPAADGHFSLSNVPPGSYELVAWHRSAGFFRRQVTAKAGETLKIDLMMPVDRSGSGEALQGRTVR